MVQNTHGLLFLTKEEGAGMLFLTGDDLLSYGSIEASSISYEKMSPVPGIYFLLVTEFSEGGTVNLGVTVSSDAIDAESYLEIDTNVSTGFFEENLLENAVTLAAALHALGGSPDARCTPEDVLQHALSAALVPYTSLVIERGELGSRVNFILRIGDFATSENVDIIEVDDFIQPLYTSYEKDNGFSV